MKQLFLFAFLIGIFASLSAQKSFQISPGDTTVAAAPAGTVTIFDIWQHNLSNRTIVFKWKPVTVNMPQGWDYSMCDKGTCYPGIPGGTMADVVVGDSGFLGLNVIPNNLNGTAIVSCYVYDDSFPNDGDTVTWIIHSDANASIGAISKINTTSFYPNPVRNILEFNTGAANILVMDLQGKILCHYNSEIPKYNVDLSSLQDGIYLVQITSATGKIERTTVVKQ